MILIDANCYLRFYDTPKLADLLPALTEIRDHIFVSQQISQEVERRKVGLVASYFNEQFKSLINAARVEFPPFLPATHSLAERVHKGNAMAREGRELLSASKQELIRTVLGLVSESKDDISQALAAILNPAAIPTPVQLHRARLRRERGNPPGKKDDPLGDQVTWEQFLEELKEKEDAWIVTNDGDYIIRHGESQILNSFLFREVQEKIRGGRIFCLSSISTLLPRFQEDSTQEIALPPPGQLREIEREEQRSRIYGVPSFSDEPPDVCPRCGARDSFPDAPTAIRSRFGGVTFQYDCYKCGYWYDTGIAMD